MGLQLWTNESGHYFVDTEAGGIQVGQTWENADGSWMVEVNDAFLPVPDLEVAKRLFVDLYDQSRVVKSPLADWDQEDGLEAEFEIVDLDGPSRDSLPQGQ